ncbi:MAG: Nif3-like dinuclear metal center hexameric protein [Ferruginibacter sp.]
MFIKEIINKLELIAPIQLQEDYDNAGLLTGELSWECSGVLICLDTMEEVIDEAIEKKCNLVIAHHPVIFGGLKKINGKNHVERTIIKAIKNDIAIYAIHTNLDNVLQGVNGRIADKLNLGNRQVLRPKDAQLKKLITFAPVDKAVEVREALFTAGAGNLGKYNECSFNTEGTGTFKAKDNAEPYVGEKGKLHEEKELKIEVIFPAYLEQKIVRAMIETHPYEEVAYDIFSLGNFLSDVGSGLIGELKKPIPELQLLENIKDAFGIKLIRHTAFTGKTIKKIAICGGAGIFLLADAIKARADVFITGDVKYHDFFDAEGVILLADIGHYESEQFTIELIYDILKENFPNFALLKTGIITNPVHYFAGKAE